MMRVCSSVAFLVALLFLAGPAAPASAQMLIWNLPKEDGAWVRFEGAYKQTRARPNANAGDENLKWRSELTISSVGRETVDGEECRWVEFKAITKPDGLEQKPGPGDVFVYKVLIPENRVIGKTVDAENIPVTYLPIVKGWRRVGQREPQSVTEKALAVYPTIALVTYYPNLKAEGDEEELQVGGMTVKARLWKGERVFENATGRSANAASLWLSDEVPFGLARFQVTLTQDKKELAASAEEFKRASLIEVDMAVVATGNDARSELGEAN